MFRKIISESKKDLNKLNILLQHCINNLDFNNVRLAPYEERNIDFSNMIQNNCNYLDISDAYQNLSNTENYGDYWFGHSAILLPIGGFYGEMQRYVDQVQISNQNNYQGISINNSWDRALSHLNTVIMKNFI